MNELNLPENTLRSWRPRRPTAGLKRRLFESEHHSTHSAGWLWARLAPALACACLTLMVLRHDAEGYRPARPTMTLASSNSQAAARSPEEALSTQNHVAGVTFDWTNSGVFQSSMPFASSNNLSQ